MEIIQNLGILISLGVSNADEWDAVLQKIWKQIQFLGAQWLNVARQVVLIKLVLSSLPVYMDFGLIAPKGIIHQIGVFLRKFLWKGGKNNEKLFDLVNLSTMCLPKIFDGLAIKDP